MKNLIILLYFLNCGNLNAQKTNGIQIITNPFLMDFGNLEKRYTIQDCETVFSNHKKSPSFEIGAIYHHDFNSKWGWGAGVTWRYAKFESNYKFTLFDQPNNVMAEYNTNSIVNYSILKFQISYKVNQRMTIYSYLNIELPISEILNSSPKPYLSFGATNYEYTPDGEIITPLQWNDIAVEHYGYDTQINITPEINLSYEIFKGFSATAGFRYKFWKTNSPIIQAKVEGFTWPENYSNDKTIYLSQVNNKDFSVVIGFSYQFKREKK